MKNLKYLILSLSGAFTAPVFSQGGPPPPPGVPIDEHINLLYFAAIFAVLFFIIKFRSKGHNK